MIRTKRWRRAEYEHLIGLGAFRPDEQLELLAGDLVVREPQGGAHARAIELCNDALRAAHGPHWRVRVQLPVALDDESEPEPDFSVFQGSPREADDRIPSRPALVVEVADSSLDFDRREKASLYARAGVADYWIVNLVDHDLEIHREPVLDTEAPSGWRYLAVSMLGREAFVTPLVAPQTRISVADLLP
jgi:Uma2 family endonuclease